MVGMSLHGCGGNFREFFWRLRKFEPAKSYFLGCFRNTAAEFPPLRNITLSLQQMGPKGRSCRTGKRSPGERREGVTGEGMSRAHVKCVVADKFQDAQGEGR